MTKRLSPERSEASLMWLALVALLCAGCQRPDDLHAELGDRPTVARLSCHYGHVLAWEMGRHTAKVWCVPADGGSQ